MRWWRFPDSALTAIPATAEIQNLRRIDPCEDLRVWIPAFAGMTKEAGPRVSTLQHAVIPDLIRDPAS